MSEVIYLVFFISCLLGVESIPHRDTSLGIVGGHSVNITEVPFMARYRSLDLIINCGAVIVNPRFVLSTAFCFYYMSSTPSIAYVTVGTDDPKRNGQSHNVTAGFPHPKYIQYSGLDYDIAVLQLQNLLKFNDRVNAIPLAGKDLVIPEGAVLDTYGFGYYNFTNNLIHIPDRLQKVSVPYVNYDNCKKLFPNVTQRMICTYSEGIGPCVNDEGGPLVYENKLVGIQAFTYGCGLKDNANIHSYIPSLIKFIDDTIEINA